MKLLSVERNINSNTHYPPITFSNVPVMLVQNYKHLGLTLDSELNFYEHISSIL